jgi:hypothetical protein
MVLTDMTNESKPATLGSTLVSGYDLKGACSNAKCRREVLIETTALETMAVRYGREAILYDIMQRVTCKACKSKVDLMVHTPAHMFGAGGRPK